MYNKNETKGRCRVTLSFILVLYIYIQNSENNNCERHEVNDQFWKLSIAVLQPSSANIYIYVYI